MVDFVTAVKSVSYHGRRRKLKGRDKADVIRNTMMRAVNPAQTPATQPAPLSPLAQELRREINVTAPMQTSVKNWVYEMKTKMDFGGIFAPWSKIKE